MRLSLVFLVVLGLAGGWSAEAQTGGEAAVASFQSALSGQCPQKRLELLSPAGLRDGLDDYKGALPQDLHDQLDASERDLCSTTDAGAACVNAADLVAIDRAGHMPDAARWICGAFLRCRDQNVCDAAR